MPTPAAQRVGPRLNFAITVQGGECNAATQTLFSFEREASYLSEVFRLNLNFYESEMLIERDFAYVSLFFKITVNNLYRISLISSYQFFTPKELKNSESIDGMRSTRSYFLDRKLDLLLNSFKTEAA